jgi:hypothetical protein
MNRVYHSMSTCPWSMASSCHLTSIKDYTNISKYQCINTATFRCIIIRIHQNVYEAWDPDVTLHQCINIPAHRYMNTATSQYINIWKHFLSIPIRWHTNISTLQYSNLSIKHRSPVLPDMTISTHYHIGISTYQYSNTSMYQHMYAIHQSIQQHINIAIYRYIHQA